MDFGSVLYTAQRNDEDSRQSKGWYQTGFAPPKKEQREKKLSVNIQKFLARKEAEENQKKLEAELKKKELLKLRSEDKKSVKRVQSMVKRTKSFNKSAIEDAIDHNNTAITAAGLLQPDEDDYGYVSQEASAIYDQLVNRYNCQTTEDALQKKLSTKTVKDISTVKDRVKAALLREEEEKLLPRKRKRKTKETDPDQTSAAEDSDNSCSEKNDEEPKPEKFKIPKKKVQAPPPIDFQSLLKLAEKKQFEPIMIEKPVEDKPERPMTQKEKREYMQERERKMRREMLVTNPNSSKPSQPVTKKLKSVEKPSSSSSVIPKSENKTSQKVSSLKSNRIAPTSSQKEKIVTIVEKQPSVKTVRIEEKPKFQTDRPPTQKPASGDKLKSNVQNKKLCNVGDQKSNVGNKKLCNGGDLRSNIDSKKLCNGNDKFKSQISNIDIEKKKMLMMKKLKEERQLEQRQSSASIKSSVERQELIRMKAMKKSPETLQSSNAKSSGNQKVTPSLPSSSGKKIQPREAIRAFPPRDIKQFPPPDMIRSKKLPPKPVRRRVIESDDEYDSELDDFIDDSEAGGEFSALMNEVLGGYRSKYRGRIDDDDDFDDECMVSNFADLEKEEYNSLVTAVREDLEDVRRTKLEKQRKIQRIKSRG